MSYKQSFEELVGHSRTRFWELRRLEKIRGVVGWIFGRETGLVNVLRNIFDERVFINANLCHEWVIRKSFEELVGRPWMRFWEFREVRKDQSCWGLNVRGRNRFGKCSSNISDKHVVVNAKSCHEWVIRKSFEQMFRHPRTRFWEFREIWVRFSIRSPQDTIF